MTKEEMLHRISSKELTEWMAFERIEGLLNPMWRTEQAGALVASVIAEVNRNTDKRKSVYTPADFMTNWKKAHEKKDRQSPETQMGIFRRMGAAIKAGAAPTNRGK